MKFILIREQDGGCDYTIGCGVTWEIIEADSREDAIADLRASALHEDDEHNFCSRYERELAEAYLIDAPDLDLSANLLPLDEWRAERAEAEERKEKRRKTADERAQYEALKRKYG